MACDICDKEQLLRCSAGGDVIINLAAEHRDAVIVLRGECDWL